MKTQVFKMFLIKQNEEKKEKYKKLLKLMCLLSNLFSEGSSIPFLHYRVAENLFCNVFNAENLARSDVSIDAKKDKLGFGIKTFLHKNGNCLEKIAEFNRERKTIKELENNRLKMIKKISFFRNRRIESTKQMFDVDNLIYHCITRDIKKIKIYETQMEMINIEKIKLDNKKRVNNTISFNDGINEYSFNMSKSTLYKRFLINPIEEFDVDILKNPFEMFEMLFVSEIDTQMKLEEEKDFVILPLYSPIKEKFVQIKSGLNQWNARGRKRNPDEVYISIPSFIHKHKPGFFPGRNTNFNLNLPNNKNISAKICQDNDKALMSNPNSDLGKWILRDILKVKEGELVTYDKLFEIGIDSVEIVKNSDLNFSINFKKIGSYENFSKMFLSK
ncbi:MAG: NgoFVII family restriction endonuclease [Candidatus Muirbacterium halophilum]|nr:NgoFVII family restriction endonuclease [Candidatus Muirbacterium halophilum]MCK9476034.1 NgoFVII family restriction endonuclease [Candidatus Muirbacterium halophilum]